MPTSAEVALVYRAWLINEARRERFRAACKARGWEFIEFYYGKTVWQIYCTARTARNTYWKIQAEVPQPPSIDDASRTALDDALVAAIAVFETELKPETPP